MLFLPLARARVGAADAWSLAADRSSRTQATLVATASDTAAMSASVASRQPKR
jgi:hypothetical protein